MSDTFRFSSKSTTVAAAVSLLYVFVLATHSHGYQFFLGAPGAAF